MPQWCRVFALAINEIVGLVNTRCCSNLVVHCKPSLRARKKRKPSNAPTKKHCPKLINFNFVNDAENRAGERQHDERERWNHDSAARWKLRRFASNSLRRLAWLIQLRWPSCGVLRLYYVSDDSAMVFVAQNRLDAIFSIWLSMVEICGVSRYTVYCSVEVR